MGMEIKQFDVFLITLNPTRGREINKTRPCLVISPNEMNNNISTVIVAPMTSKGRNYPTRVSCIFQGINGQIVLDQIRTVDKLRLIKKLGTISSNTQRETLNKLAEIFAP